MCSSAAVASRREPDLEGAVHPAAVQGVLQERRRFETCLDDLLLGGRQLVLHVPDVRTSLRLQRVVLVAVRGRAGKVVPHGLFVRLECPQLEAQLTVDDLGVVVAGFETGHVRDVLGLHVAKGELFGKVPPSPPVILHPCGPIGNYDGVALPGVAHELLPRGAREDHRRGQALLVALGPTLRWEVLLQRGLPKRGVRQRPKIQILEKGPRCAGSPCGKCKAHRPPH
mmetsp:Transcript_104848/g.328175  ORF Transcript_104848/g.328175 Transcript_104848/m.328175 type:complete len:226 (-) Transcript_104848:25-702(-)